MKEFRLFEIDWDAGKKTKNQLPKEVFVEIEEEDFLDLDLDEYFGDMLSDEYGFCHDGFLYEEIK